jgi:hypothetical protein
LTDLDSYVNKTVPFKFNGVELRFDLSQALFSSFDIDVGTRLLLKAAARDPVLASSRRILDEGCGVGVIGLCAAKAFPAAEVLLRDRDGLAVAFAERNRIANKLRGTGAWKDPLTGETREARPAPSVEQGLIGDGREAGDGECRSFDFVFSNLPAKAGAPVLASFFERLSGRLGPPLLVPGGRAAIVIVNPLAEAAEAWIAEAGLMSVANERGGMHRVYIVERGSVEGRGAESWAEVPAIPLGAYSRGESRFKLADLSYRASGFWGLPEFDTPGFGTAVAAELLSRVRASAALCGAAFRDALFLDPGVGHLVLWSSRALGLKRVTAASRDALSLRATEANLLFLSEASRPAFAGIGALGVADLEPASVDLLAECPDVVPERDWIGPAWELAGRLLRSGGVYLAWCSATEMARLEKRRPAGSGGTARWSLLGQKRKKGFVAAAWRKG